MTKLTEEWMDELTAYAYGDMEAVRDAITEATEIAEKSDQLLTKELIEDILEKILFFKNR